ncbi:MAG: arylamine N-acetyltransferase [Ignavibacteriaceae bacterium]
MDLNLLFHKYLKLLGVNAEEPTFKLLNKIVKSHTIKVPFENISKLLYKKQGMKNIPDLSTYLEGIEKFNFGGTCYANNYYLNLLLNHLGFDVKLCGADMKYPDVHLISMVTIRGVEYIVDGGYAAPFFEPLPRDLTFDHIINYDKEKYIIKPRDQLGRTKVEQYYDGKLQHWYTAKPQLRTLEEFQKVIEDSYSDDAVFMNAIRITKFSGNGSLVLKNLLLTETRGNKSTTKKFSLAEITNVIEENFGIPLSIIQEAISWIKELKDIYD